MSVFIVYLKHMYLKHTPLIWRFINHISTIRPLIWRSGDSGSLYIDNTPPDLAIPGHHTSTTRPLIWRFRFIICLKHGPSCGDSVFIVIYPQHALSLAIPVHHLSTTPPHLAVPVRHMS